MLKEAIEKILSLSSPSIVKFHDLDYTNQSMRLVEPPGASMVTLHTLTGIADAIRHEVDTLAPDDWLLQVVSHTEVQLIQRCTDVYGRRLTLLASTRNDTAQFPFGRYLDREEFAIGLQSQFVQTPELLAVVGMVRSLTASTVAQAEDDGISQSVTVKRGVTLKENVQVKGRVLLAPFRTFREVEQPASEFVFRLQSKDGGIPMCALFEADGGKWRHDAVLTIKAWLESQQLNIPVIA